MSKPRNMEPPLPYFWPTNYRADGPIGVGHAGTLYEPAPQAEVVLWVPESRTGWKSDRWVARERPQTERRKLGFGRS